MPPWHDSHWALTRPDPPCIPPEHGFVASAPPGPSLQQNAASMPVVVCAVTVLTLEPQEHRKALSQ
eukprot:1714767-Lingulodinium_polyedra.AAC.1